MPTDNELVVRLRKAAELLDGLEVGRDCEEYSFARGDHFQAMTYNEEAFRALHALPEAADRIEAADKRIAELERALEPFANHPEFHAPDDWAVTQLDVGDGDPQPGVTAGDFRAARAALQQKERDDG